MQGTVTRENDLVTQLPASDVVEETSELWTENSVLAAQVREFCQKLKDKVEEQQRRRLSHLQELSTITNSAKFRDRDNHDSPRPEVSEQMLVSLKKMVNEDARISASQLTFIRRLGEGGYAYVDLFEAKGRHGNSMLYAVKVMKDRCHSMTDI